MAKQQIWDSLAARCVNMVNGSFPALFKTGALAVTSATVAFATNSHDHVITFALFFTLKETADCLFTYNLFQGVWPKGDITSKLLATVVLSHATSHVSYKAGENIYYRALPAMEENLIPPRPQINQKLASWMPTQ